MKVRVPADVDMADRVLAGLTARQVAILGAHALVLWGLWLAVGRVVPSFVFGAVAVPIATIGFIWATVNVEGTALERLAAAALRYLHEPRRRVLAPEGLAATPTWLPRPEPVAALVLPMDEPDDRGIVELGEEGSAVIARASSINFALRSEEEQHALVEAFGRLLNSLDAPVQILIRSDRIDVDAIVNGLTAHAGQLAHPALEESARAHGEFLRALGARRDVLERQLLMCFREPSAPEVAAAHLEHRIEEASTLLRGLGIRLDRLDEPEASRSLARAFDPESVHGSSVVHLSGVVEGER